MQDAREESGWAGEKRHGGLIYDWLTVLFTQESRVARTGHVASISGGRAGESAPKIHSRNTPKRSSPSRRQRSAFVSDLEHLRQNAFLPGVSPMQISTPQTRTSAFRPQNQSQHPPYKSKPPTFPVPDFSPSTRSTPKQCKHRTQISIIDFRIAKRYSINQTPFYIFTTSSR